MLASGLCGAFFHYSFLRGVRLGIIGTGPWTWIRCVAASALMLAVCGSLVVRYFHDDTPYVLTLALWPVFILSLEPGYRTAGMQSGHLGDDA